MLASCFVLFCWIHLQYKIPFKLCTFFQKCFPYITYFANMLDMVAREPLPKWSVTKRLFLIREFLPAERSSSLDVPALPLLVFRELLREALRIPLFRFSMSESRIGVAADDAAAAAGVESGDSRLLSSRLRFLDQKRSM